MTVMLLEPPLTGEMVGLEAVMGSSMDIGYRQATAMSSKVSRLVGQFIGTLIAREGRQRRVAQCRSEIPHCFACNEFIITLAIEDSRSPPKGFSGALRAPQTGLASVKAAENVTGRGVQPQMNKGGRR